MDTKGYQGPIAKYARIVTNDTTAQSLKLKMSGNVTVPVFVSPSSRYIFFDGTESEKQIKEADIWTTLEKPLELEETEFTLSGKVKYELKVVEKGRRYKITFQRLPGSETTYRGFLTLKTNWEEQPEIKFIIRVHLSKAEDSGD